MYDFKPSMPASKSSAPFRIAIVGGGLGGLITALCINHHVRDVPIEIDVYEQAAQYKEIGAGIGLGPNANVLFHKIGIGHQINSIAGTRSGIWITFRRFDTSEEVFTVKPVTESDTNRNTPCARSELLDVLVDNIRKRNAATLHTDKCCINLEDHGESVVLKFKDGSTAEANLVVACDGIHSNIRALFATDKPVYSGIIAYRGVIPVSTLPPWPFPSYSVLWMAKGAHFLVFTISGNRSLNIVAFVTKAESQVEDLRESWTSTCPKAELEKDFEGFDEYVQQIIRQMPDPASKWKINYREPLDQWVHMNGKVAIVGDAAHSMTPHQGAGAGQAVEDAYILSKCLAEYLKPDSKGRPLSEWMQLYQTVRLPRAQKVARTSKVAGETYEQTTDDLKDLPYEEGLPIVKDRIIERMKWIWVEDLDAAYERVKQEVGL